MHDLTLQIQIVPTSFPGSKWVELGIPPPPAEADVRDYLFALEDVNSWLLGQFSALSDLAFKSHQHKIEVYERLAVDEMNAKVPVRANRVPLRYIDAELNPRMNGRPACEIAVKHEDYASYKFLATARLIGMSFVRQHLQQPSGRHL